MRHQLSSHWEERLKFESLISDLSALFINLPVDRFDVEIEKGQRRVCEALGLHRSLFTEFSSDKHLLMTTHMWHDEQVPERHPVALTDEWAYFANKILNGENVLFSDPNELPSEKVSPAIRQFFQNIGVTSVAAFPFRVGDRIIGCVSWKSYGVRRNWPDMVVDRLRLISEGFANALSRKRTEEALRQSITEIKELKHMVLLHPIWIPWRRASASIF